jgi:hypothetical protein
MARGDIEVPISSETKAFKQGIETGVIKPLEDAEKALEELGKSKGPDQLERGLEDAQDATERLKRETKQTADAIDREFRDSYRKVSSTSKDSLGDAKRATQDLSDEASETGREMAASFKEPADALDAMQELAANALVGLGPAGVIAGGAAALGIGVVTEVLQTQQEEADKLKEAMAGAYQEAVSEGRKYLDEAQIIAGVNDILFNPDKKSIYEQAINDARTLGVESNDVLRALAGDQEKINLLIEAGTRAGEEALNPRTGALDISTQEFAQLGSTIQRYEDLKALHEENNARAERGLEIERDIEAEMSEANRTRRANDQERGAALEAYYARAANPPNPVITPTVDLSAAESKLAQFARGRTVTVTVNGVTRTGNQVW